MLLTPTMTLRGRLNDPRGPTARIVEPRPRRVYLPGRSLPGRQRWNGSTDFVFFARRGELASNRHGDHEISMLALHLLQNCLVYINTLMLQQVLAQPHWSGRLSARDLDALTPRIWGHVNPYGRYELDMDARLPLD